MSRLLSCLALMTLAAPLPARAGLFSGDVAVPGIDHSLCSQALTTRFHYFISNDKIYEHRRDDRVKAARVEWPFWDAPSCLTYDYASDRLVVLTPKGGVYSGSPRPGQEGWLHLLSGVKQLAGPRSDFIALTRNGELVKCAGPRCLALEVKEVSRIERLVTKDPGVPEDTYVDIVVFADGQTAEIFEVARDPSSYR